MLYQHLKNPFKRCQMSRLSQLAQKIRSLPDIDVERSRLMVTRQVTRDARDVANGLVVVLSQAPHIDSMTRGALVAAVNESILFFAAQAKSLKKLIQRQGFGSEP